MKYHEKEAVAYCGSCKPHILQSSLNHLLLGRRFICPRWSASFPHIGVVIDMKDSEMRGWLCFQHFLVCYSTRYLCRRFWCLLMRYLKWYPLRRSIRKWARKWAKWILTSPLIMLTILFVSPLFALLVLAPHRDSCAYLAAFIAGLCIFDILAYNTSVAFVTQLPRLPLRTAILTGIAFLELSLAFAILDLALLKGQMNYELDRMTAPYFSLVTIVTLGYGDIHPLCRSYKAMGFIMAEIIFGLYFLSILFAVMVGWANQSSTLPILCEILDESRKLDKNMAYSAELMKP